MASRPLPRLAITFAIFRALTCLFVGSFAAPVQALVTTTFASAVQPIAGYFSAMVSDPVDGEVYVANFGSANVNAIDPADWATTSIVAPRSADSLGVNATNGNVYFGNHFSRYYVSMIDGASNTVTAYVPTPGGTP